MTTWEASGSTTNFLPKFICISLGCILKDEIIFDVALPFALFLLLDLFPLSLRSRGSFGGGFGCHWSWEGVLKRILEWLLNLEWLEGRISRQEEESHRQFEFWENEKGRKTLANIYSPMSKSMVWVDRQLFCLQSRRHPSLLIIRRRSIWAVDCSIYRTENCALWCSTVDCWVINSRLFTYEISFSKILFNLEISSVKV